jgi:hypothetical protein
MFRAIASGIFSLLLFGLPQFAHGTVLTTCANCDGDLFAVTYYLDSDVAGVSTFDISLLADTSGNNIDNPPHLIDAVAIGINLPADSTLLSAMEFAPNGAANWTPVAGGLNAGACDGKGAFICAKANTTAFDALAPNAATAITPYEWTWEVTILDSSKGGAAAVFANGSSVKIAYSDVNGHLVSDEFPFINTPPPHENLPTVPEPVSATLVGGGLLTLGCFLARRRVRG